jgi:hypothetical protein
VRDVDVWDMPEVKRRRTNGAGDYHSLPVTNEHYRAQGSRSPYAPDRHDPYASRRAPMPPFSDSPVRDPSTPLRPFNAAMPPPPRPSPAMSWSGPIRRDGFDESLRLPPLQTAIPSSPRRTPLTDSRYGQTTSTGSSSIGQSSLSSRGGASPPRSFEAQVMTLPFKRKLEVLARVCRPAPTVGLDSPHASETRGAFVAVEGHDTKMVQAVGAAVEKGLKAAEDLAVKVWRGDISSRDELKKENTPESVSDGGGSSPVKESFPTNCFQTMLDWQQKASQISRYITTRPGSSDGESIDKGDDDEATAAAVAPPPPSAAATATVASAASAQTPPQSADATSHKVPVALVKDGFSLTVSDRLACTSAISDTYQIQDHWQWMASLWRGTVCPDLVVYAKPSGEDEVGSLGAVEFNRRMGLIVVRMAWGKPLEEATERRISFEVLEWVREGSFREPVPKLWRHDLGP